MKVPRKALNGFHPGTVQCSKGVERKRQQQAETETRENLERAFSAYGQPMETVAECRYLGLLLTTTDNNWPAVAGNIKKARRSWGRLDRVLDREGADTKVSQTFYIAVTHQVLLFGAETWVLTKNMEVPRKALNGRHLGTAQCAKGAERKQQQLADTETRENLERAFSAYG